MSFQSLTASSTPEQIAAAYRDYSNIAGNNVAVQGAARTMLLNKGVAAPAIDQAFSLFANPVELKAAPAPVVQQPVATVPVAAPKTAVSTPAVVQKPPVTTSAQTTPASAAAGGVSDAFVLSWLARNPNPTTAQIAALKPFGVTADRVKSLSGASTTPAPIAAPAAPKAVTPTAENPFPGMTVEDLYRMHAGKEPDAEGLAFWKSAFGPEISEAERAQFIQSVVDVQNKPAVQPAPAASATTPAQSAAAPGATASTLTKLPENAQDKPITEILGDLKAIYKNVGAMENVVVNSGEAGADVMSQPVLYGGGWQAWEKPPVVIGTTGDGWDQQNILSKPELGGFSQIVGDKANYYDTEGKFLYSRDVNNSLTSGLKPLVNMALTASSFGGLGTLAQLAASGYNSIKAAEQGDWGTAIVGALGIAGAPANVLGLDKSTLDTLKTAKTSAQVVNAVSKGDPIAIANALAATDTGKELLSSDIGGGVTIGNVLDTAKVTAAVKDGNLAAAASYAGSLINSPDLKVAGASLNLINAIQSGKPAAFASAMQQFESATKSSAKASSGGAKSAAETPMTEEEILQLGENRLNKAFSEYDLEAEQEAVDARTQEILDELSKAGLEEESLPTGIQTASSDGNGPFRVESAGAPIYADSPRADAVKPPPGYRLMASTEEQEVQDADRTRYVKPSGAYYDYTANAWFVPSGEFDLSGVKDYSDLFNGENQNLTDEDVSFIRGNDFGSGPKPDSEYTDFLESIGIKNPSSLGPSPSNQEILDLIGYQEAGSGAGKDKRSTAKSDRDAANAPGKRPTSEPDLGTIEVVGERPTSEPDFGTLEVIGERPAPEPDFGTMEIVGERPTPEPDFGTIEVVGERPAPEPDLGTIEVVGERPEPDLGTIDIVAPRPEPEIKPPVTPPVTPPVKPPVVKPPVTVPPQVVQQVALQLGVPATSQIAQDIAEALYGTMDYLDISEEFSPSARKAGPAATQKQMQQTKMAQGGYLDTMLAENMTADDLLNLLR